MPTLEDIDTKLDRIIDLLGSGPSPGVLAPPADFTVVLNDDRTVTVSWSATPDQVEVHEFSVDPLDTLKATLTAFATQRTSSVLEGGHDYTYAVRSRRGNQVSEFSERITVYVPARDEQEPDEEEPPGGEDPGPQPGSPIDLRLWTLMLPVMKPDGDTPKNNYPAKYAADELKGFLFGRDGGLVFRAPANGAHSKNSKYVRTELRQMADTDWTEAAFSSAGSHSLEAELSIDTSNLKTRKRANCLQIHDGGDDVCQIMKHESEGLGFMHKDGKEFIPIDPLYLDGTKFRCRILAENDRIKVWYNDRLVVDVAKKGSSWYWKAGIYNQTGGASEFTESDDAYGEVVLYSLTTTGGPF